MWKRFFCRRKRPITKEEIMAAIDDLTAQAGRVVAGIDALIAKLSTAPVDNSAQLQSLADSLHAAADKADAIVNPPAPAPAPAPEPAPAPTA